MLSALQEKNFKAAAIHKKGPALFSYSERNGHGVEPMQEKTALIAEESKHGWKQMRFIETTWN